MADPVAALERIRVRMRNALETGDHRELTLPLVTVSPERFDHDAGLLVHGCLGYAEENRPRHVSPQHARSLYNLRRMGYVGPPLPSLSKHPSSGGRGQNIYPRGTR